MPAFGAALGFAASSLAVLLRTSEPRHALLGVAYLGLLFAIAAHDVSVRRAPNRVVYPALLLAVAGSLWLGLDAATEALLGGASAFGFFWLVAIIGRGAMGMGDVKVAALCGMAVGLHRVPWLIAFTFLSGLVVCAALLLFGGYRRQDTIAFTPFLALGTALSLCLT